MSVGGKPTFEKYADKVASISTKTLSKLIPCAAALVLEGQGKSPLGNFGRLDQKAATEKGILLALLNDGKYVIGEVGPQQFGPLYDRLGQWQRESGQIPSAALRNKGIKEWWWFRPTANPNPLSLKLRYNAHFPVDELDLLPMKVPPVEVKISKRDEKIAPGAFVTAERIHCTPGSLPTVAKAFTSGAAGNVVKRLVLECENNEVLDKTALGQVFTKGSSVHTLVLREASTKLHILPTLQADCPGLGCVVLEDCVLGDFEGVMKSIRVLQVGSSALEEFVIDSSSHYKGSGMTLELAKQCDHVSFAPKPDLSIPPPRIAAVLAAKEGEMAPLQPALSSKEFEDLQANRPKSRKDRIFGLPTAYGSIVPIRAAAIPYCCLLQDMIAHGEDEDGEGDQEGPEEVQQSLIPMELEPPVGKASVALAVHFVTQHVSDAIHSECVAAETLAFQDENFVSYSWCADFDTFRRVYIQQGFTSSARRIQILCELMAIAAYLNIPTLKRFGRAALVMEEANVEKGGDDGWAPTAAAPGGTCDEEKETESDEEETESEYNGSDYSDSDDWGRRQDTW